VSSIPAICCTHPWVSCKRHRTAYAGPSEGTLHRYLVCRVNRTVSLVPFIRLHLLSSMYSAYVELPQADSRIKGSLPQPLHFNRRRPSHQLPHNATLSPSATKQGTAPHLAQHLVSPPTTPSPPPPPNHSMCSHSALAKDTSIILRPRPSAG